MRRKRHEPDTQAIAVARSPLPGLFITLALVWLPLFLELPVWMVGSAGLMLVARMRRPWPGQHPSLWIRLVLIGLGLAFVLFTFHGLNGALPGSALLLLMAALKAFESTSLRDLRILVLIGYFEIGADLFLSQAPLLVLYLALVTLLLTALWLHLESAREKKHPWSAWPEALRWLVRALPTALILFIVFPRIPGPLWGLGPLSAHPLGLPRHLDPGSLNRIVLSHQIVFRIRYLGPPPPRPDRYFRGPVFNRFTGTTWLPGRTAHLPPPRTTQLDGASYRYRITLEPTETRALYALDFPVDWSISARLDSLFELRSPFPIRRLTRYEAISYPDLRMKHLPEMTRLRDLALPIGADPRSRALATQWREENPHPLAIIARALSYFHDQPFYYTLHPPLLTKVNPIDDFLFRTRRGFCQHYASAFAFLMRAAGIPARVVTGFVGGHYNSVGGFYVIRESDAHAWDEVWIHGRGWMRVDPTQAIAASRVSPGARAVLSGRLRLAGLDLPDQGLWLHLQTSWDAFDALWDRWVLGYGPRLQEHLLHEMGFGLAQSAEWLGFILMAFGLPFFMNRLHWPDRFRTTRRIEEKAWRGLLRKMRPWGVPRAWEPPMAFALRMRNQLIADKGQDFLTLAHCYSDLHYQNDPPPEEVRRFAEATSRYDPGSKNSSQGES
jgi:transglutaminase-like putative cysteine protease